MKFPIHQAQLQVVNYVISGEIPPAIGKLKIQHWVKME